MGSKGGLNGKGQAVEVEGEVTCGFGESGEKELAEREDKRKQGGLNGRGKEEERAGGGGDEVEEVEEVEEVMRWRR